MCPGSGGVLRLHPSGPRLRRATRPVPHRRRPARLLEQRHYPQPPGGARHRPVRHPPQTQPRPRLTRTPPGRTPRPASTRGASRSASTGASRSAAAAASPTRASHPPAPAWSSSTWCRSSSTPTPTPAASPRTSSSLPTGCGRPAGPSPGSTRAHRTHPSRRRVPRPRGRRDVPQLRRHRTAPRPAVAGPRHRCGRHFVEKSAPSAFFPGRCRLPGLLQERGIDTVLITGTVTQVCCESSARDAFTLGYQVVMVADANATRPRPGLQRHARHDLPFIRRRTPHSRGPRSDRRSAGAAIVRRRPVPGDQPTAAG